MALCLAPLALVLGCGSADRSDSGPFVRDSAGIRIVTSRAVPPEGAEAWSIASVPRLEIGVADGPDELQFYRIAGVTRLGDGRIVVANAGTAEIRYFDSTGRHLRSAGRRGAGPGEFRSLSWIAAVDGDSVFAWDRSQRRLTVLDERGDIARTATIEPVSEEVPSGDRPFTVPFPEVRTALRDGALLAQPIRVFPSVPDGVRRDSVDLVLYDRTGRVSGGAGRYPGTEVFALGGVGFFGPPAFARRLHFVPAGDELYVTTGDRFEVRLHTLSGGGLRRILRVDGAPRPVTPADVAEYVEYRRSAATGEEARRFTDRVLEAMPFPESMPAYQQLFVDPTGHVWAQRHRWPPDAEPVWDVFHKDGRVVGRARGPRGLRVYEIGSDYLLGVWRNGMGVERVRLYGLHRPAA